MRSDPRRVPRHAGLSCAKLAPRGQLALLALLALSASSLSCGDAALPPAEPTCSTMVASGTLSVPSLDKYDFLFVLESSPAMAAWQTRLQADLPELVHGLLSGVGPDGERRFTPLADIHVGVVSSDLGAAGVAEAARGCSAVGDDARLLHAPTGPGCEGAYPSFLSYADRPPLLSAAPLATPESVSADLACVLPGATGCGYAQPLEAALKALWPAREATLGLDPPEPEMAITFFGDPSTESSLGHGEREHAGFLRNDRWTGLSLVSVVIVAAQDDCSIADPALVGAAPDATSSPAARCAPGAPSLQPTERYARALPALRAGNEQLVTLSVIAGLPVGLTATLPQDYGDNPATRDAFHAELLAHPRMQPVQRADGTLAPACESGAASATPAPRLVAAAQALGAHGRVLSICEDDWSVALDYVADLHGRHFGASCLPRRPPRDRDGLVACEVTWDLPHPDMPFGPLTRCDQAPGLLTHDPARAIGERGGERCIVRQLAVHGPPEARAVASGFGWYLDDFSLETQRECTASFKQRIVFSPGAEPPLGVRASFECVQTHRLVPLPGPPGGNFADVPRPFDPCDPTNTFACIRELADYRDSPLGDGWDRTLTCHSQRLMCVLPCPNGSCPEGFTCNAEPEAFCEPMECRVPG
jgi:hypothetical protein